VTALLVALGAALGAPLRVLVDVEVRRLVGQRLPWGIAAVNVSGCLLAGALVGAAPPASALALLGTGVLGGYTTFSTYALHTVQLGEVGRVGAAVGYAAGSAAVSLAAAALGYALTS